MATLKMSGPKFTISANNDYVITNASDELAAGGVLVQIVNDNSFTSGQITVKGESSQILIAGAADSFQAICYRGLNVNGTAGTGAYVSTAITTNSIIFIPSCGMAPVLSVASLASGSASVYVTPVIGSAAL